MIAPTQRFGYVEKKKPAGPAEELKWIETIRDQYYPWLKNVPVPVSSNVYETYGVSSTPTLVFIDRDGKVAAYNPGQLTAEQLEPIIQKITSGATDRASQDFPVSERAASVPSGASSGPECCRSL